MEQLDDLSLRFEQQSLIYEQNLKQKENELILQLHQKISENSESSKNIEIKIYEELQLLDDKLKITEKALSDIKEELMVKEKNFKKEKKDLIKELEGVNKKVKELMTIKEKYEQLEGKLKSQLEENHEEMKKKIEKLSLLEQNKVILNKRLMTIATEIRIVELKNENINRDCDELRTKLMNCEQEYEDHLKHMSMEFNTQRNNYEAAIENLQMELESTKKELELFMSKVYIYQIN